MGRKLYVGNIPFQTTEAELEELFGRSGAVESVNVVRDMATGRARGFAFVEMATEEEAQKAAADLNEYQLGGRTLTVNEARPKPSGGGFGGGGRPGGGGGGGSTTWRIRRQSAVRVRLYPEEPPCARTRRGIASVSRSTERAPSPM
jgi:RNA recognition motif-containing protein